TIYASDSSCDAIGYGMDYMIGIHITVIISVLLLIRLAFPRKFGNVPIYPIKRLVRAQKIPEAAELI
ncbi:MAG: hypothetical protein MR333_08695, partial [Porphyromonadaceae bacterium]|nr:hypothetical protein [Porphyromonadaceae bacterium]